MNPCGVGEGVVGRCGIACGEAWCHCGCSTEDCLPDPICDCGQPGYACACPTEPDILLGPAPTCPSCGSLLEDCPLSEISEPPLEPIPDLE